MSFRIRRFLVLAVSMVLALVPGLTANQSAEAKSPFQLVLICHKGNEIIVSAHALPGHLAHGDHQINRFCNEDDGGGGR